MSHPSQLYDPGAWPRACVGSQPSCTETLILSSFLEPLVNKQTNKENDTVIHIVSRTFLC
jgi:hypothetical protein